MSSFADTQAYGFYAQAGNIETTWNGNVTLPAPPLNISGRYFSGYLGDFGNPIYGHQWRDPRTGEFTFQDKSRVLYLYVSGGEVYDEEYVLKHGKCQPSADEVSGHPHPVISVPHEKGCHMNSWNRMKQTYCVLSPVLTHS